MENSYGIGVTNRYELFYVDEEGIDPLETLIQIKQKQQKKITEIGKTQVLTGLQINKSAEKENKSAILNKNQNQEQLKIVKPAGQNLNKKIKENQVQETKGKSRDGKLKKKI